MPSRLIGCDDTPHCPDLARGGNRRFPVTGRDVEDARPLLDSREFHETIAHVLRGALEHRPPFLPARRGHIPVAPLLVFETLWIKTLLGHGSGSVVSRFSAHLPADDPVP